MTDQRVLLKHAMRNLTRAMHAAGRTLPRSWVAEGDPDLQSLRETDQWKRLKRRLSVKERSARPRSKQVALEAASLAAIEPRGTPQVLRAAAAERLGETPDDTVVLPETPLRSVEFRQRVWGLTGVVALVLAVLLVVRGNGMPWLLQVPLVVGLIALAVTAAYRVILAHNERSDLPTARTGLGEGGEPEARVEQVRARGP